MMVRARNNFLLSPNREPKEFEKLWRALADINLEVKYQ